MKTPSFAELTPDFLTRWDGWYPGAPPVGFLLREIHPDRWLRIHTMTASKRNPTSGWDYAELGRRYNTIADHVLGDQSLCALVIVHECGATWASHLTGIGLDASRLSSLGQLPRALWDEDEGIFAVPMCLHGGATTWRRGGFDGFFSAAAQDQLKGLLVEEYRGQAVAPYDGGADLFFATSGDRDQAKEHFANWVSPRDDGL